MKKYVQILKTEKYMQTRSAWYHIVIQLHYYTEIILYMCHRRWKRGGGGTVPPVKTYLRLVPPLEQGSIPPFCGRSQLMFTSIKLHHVYTRTERMSLQSSLDRFRTRSYQPEPGTSR